jgi:hypothetical protein
MVQLPAELLQKLQDVVSRPRTQCEQFLSNLLHNLPDDEFEEVVNQRLAGVTPSQVRLFAQQQFDKIDRHPNPKDGHLTIDEIAEAFLKETESRENEAILLYIWLNFDKIKQASEDFQGIDKAFDYVLTRRDFESFVG